MGTVEDWLTPRELALYLKIQDKVVERRSADLVTLFEGVTREREYGKPLTAEGLRKALDILKGFGR